ncbi:4Fe-4S cluster-binding domain-containing protein [Thermoclostridium stercorarium]|uniref:4Fe-4S cluster-binding domain-containing protein n=1 Tax=Thermoclostridium stercorarium TaxID=1510 RepID=UPI0004B43330|nr:4Fe-4S cluster-binding domain-containing protein [Thermoclostridium stercorarium]
MSIYVKLGYEWKLVHEGEYFYLSNVLKRQLYQVDPGIRCQIIKKINDGVELDLLESEYGESWTCFKKILEKFNVIFYSNNKSAYRDNFTFGARMASNSAFLQKAIDFRTASIELNRKCDLNCPDCGDEYCFSCLGCYKDKNEGREISENVLKKGLEHLTNFSIQNFYIQGGDPLLSFDLIKSALDILRSKNCFPRIYIVSNGIHILNLNHEQLSLLKSSNSILLLVVTSETYKSSMLSNVFSILHNYDIRTEVQYRNIPGDELKTEFRNDTLKFRSDRGESIIGQQNLVKPVDISVLSKDFIENRCFYGRIHIDVTGEIKVCNGYSQGLGNVNNMDFTSIKENLKKIWNAPDDTTCSSCGLHLICVSCPAIINKQRTDFNEKTEVCSIKNSIT